MPQRRRLGVEGYGSSEVPQPQGHARLLPPPSGKPPVRLPIGRDVPPQPPQSQQPPDPAMDLSGDPNAMLIRLLEQAGKL